MASPLFVKRRFRGPADLQAMIALVCMRPPQRISQYPFIVDLQEVSGTLGGQASIRLWEDAGGAPVGFTLLDGTSLAFEISPGVAFDDLAGQMLAWAAEGLAAIGESPAAPAELVIACREEDLRRIAFLERQGFVAQPVRTLRFMRSLEEPLPEPPSEEWRPFEVRFGATLRCRPGRDVPILSGRRRIRPLRKKPAMHVPRENDAAGASGHVCNARTYRTMPCSRRGPRCGHLHVAPVPRWRTVADRSRR